MSAKATKVRTAKTLIENLITEDGRARDLLDEAVRYQRDADAILRSATTDAEVAEAGMRNGFYRDTAKRMQRYVMIHWANLLCDLGITEREVHSALVGVLTEAVHAA
jgi:hypothetical protein